jgi:hypothetical protein
MEEDEWRSFGVRQSPGWVHYMIHSIIAILILRSRTTYSNVSKRKRLSGNDSLVSDQDKIPTKGCFTSGWTGWMIPNKI